jgi:hypothetical protein
MTTTAQDRRYAAIRTLAEEVRHVEQRSVYAGWSNPTDPYEVVRQETLVVWDVEIENQDWLAAEIRDRLLPLGRTTRWQDAVEAWAHAVETATPENWHWSFDQYLIYASFAAE